MPTSKQILNRKAERENLRQVGMTVVLILALVLGAFTLAYMSSGIHTGPVVQELSGAGDGALSNEFRF